MVDIDDLIRRVTEPPAPEPGPRTPTGSPTDPVPLHGGQGRLLRAVLPSVLVLEGPDRRDRRPPHWDWPPRRPWTVRVRSGR